jgi:hypothetical protein
MKVYTLGNAGRIPAEMAEAIGLPAYRRQADVMVAARSKTAAFALLADLKMQPDSLRHLTVDESTPTGVLTSAGVLTEGTVAVMQLVSANTPVLRVDAGGFTVVGEFVRGQFVPDADLIAAGVRLCPVEPADAYPEERELVLAQLSSAGRRLNELAAEITRVRAERAELCRRATDELSIVAEAAEALGVTPARIYQLRDRALRNRAEQGELLPGLRVEVEEPGRDPSRFPLAVVASPPDNIHDHMDATEWVWVRYDNDSVCPVRRHRVRVAVPSCSICPPEKAPYGLSNAQLGVHQSARHGIR